jgi:hypothetical protein
MADLNVVLEHQHNTQWCWAAVTQGVCRYFGDAASTQESIVCQTLDNPGCCATPVPTACNIPQPLEWALDLDTVKHLNRQTGGALSFDEVREQIETLARPVPICLMFTGQLGQTNHYCLIKGCAMIGNVPYVTVLDPSPVNGLESHIAYDDLCSGLTLGGAWTDSFTLR